MRFYRKKQIELNDEVTNQTGERPGTLHKEIAITGNLRLVQLLVAAMGCGRTALPLSVYSSFGHYMTQTRRMLDAYAGFFDRLGKS